MRRMVRICTTTQPFDEEQQFHDMVNETLNEVLAQIVSEGIKIPKCYCTPSSVIAVELDPTLWIKFSRKVSDPEHLLTCITTDVVAEVKKFLIKKYGLSL